jgi:putative N6-adenine-specific DNA methylase
MDTQLTPAGLERRLKRHLLKATQHFFAATIPGLEPMLEQEVRLLPQASAVRLVTGGVEFSGPLAIVYHANLKLRTAHRVLLRIDSFAARSYPELYNKARRRPWELYTGFEKEIAFEAASVSSRLHHTENIAKAVFDGCADHMQQLGVAVTRHKEAALRFFVRFANDRCTISADSSGTLLYKRGYRQELGHAPLRETIAAAMLMNAGWGRFPVIADPLCGSGTLIIEAALCAMNRAVGAGRSFAFLSWPWFRQSIWDRFKREARAGEKACQVRLYAADISPRAVASATNNAQRAGVADAISFCRENCMEFNRSGSVGRSGLVIANLPYGKRAFAAGDDVNEFYANWGRHLKKYCSGWTYGFIVSDQSFLKTAGLQGRRTAQFENGGIPVFFMTGTIA